MTCVKNNSEVLHHSITPPISIYDIYLWPIRVLFPQQISSQRNRVLEVEQHFQTGLLIIMFNPNIMESLFVAVHLYLLNGCLDLWQHQPPSEHKHKSPQQFSNIFRSPHVVIQVTSICYSGNQCLSSQLVVVLCVTNMICCTWQRRCFFVAQASVVPVSVCGRSCEEIRNSLVAFLHCPLAVKPFELDFQLRLEISDTQIVFSWDWLD